MLPRLDVPSTEIEAICGRVYIASLCLLPSHLQPPQPDAWMHKADSILALALLEAPNKGCHMCELVHVAQAGWANRLTFPDMGWKVIQRFLLPQVKDGNYEGIYGDMPPFGLGRFTELKPCKGMRATAAGRLGQKQSTQQESKPSQA